MIFKVYTVAEWDDFHYEPVTFVEAETIGEAKEKAIQEISKGMKIPYQFISVKKVKLILKE